MTFSFGSILVCLLVLLVLDIYLELILRIRPEFYIHNIRCVYFVVIVLLIRSVIPFNFPFTITIPIQNALSGITIFLFRTYIGPYTIIQYAVAVWGIGAIFNLFRYIVHYYRYKYILTQAATINQPLKTIVHKVLKDLDVDGMRVAVLPGQMSPAIFGITDPILLFPNYDYSESELRFIIQHEMIHHTKHDMILKIILDICVCIFWWNPLLYICRRNLLLFVEVSNDLSVVKDCTEQDKLEYATCLLHNSRKQYRGGINKYALPLINRASSLKFRVLKIFHFRNSRNNFLLMINSVILLIILTFGVVVVPEAYGISPEAKSQTFSIDPENAYIIITESGYDLYVNGNYTGTLSEISESLKSLPVYEEEK